MKEKISRNQFKKFFRNKPSWFIKSFFAIYIIVFIFILFPIPIIASIFSNESAISIFKDAFKKLKYLILSDII